MVRVLSTFGILALAASGLRVDDIENPEENTTQAALAAAAKEEQDLGWRSGKEKEIALFNQAKAEATYESKSNIAEKAAEVASSAKNDVEALTKEEEKIGKMRTDKEQAFHSACAARKAAHTALPIAEEEAEDAAHDTVVSQHEVAKAVSNEKDAEYLHQMAKVAASEMPPLVDKAQDHWHTVMSRDANAHEMLKQIQEEEAPMASQVAEAADEKQKADAILTEKDIKLRAAILKDNDKTREAEYAAHMKRMVDRTVVGHFVKIRDGLEADAEPGLGDFINAMKLENVTDEQENQAVSETSQ